MPVSSIILRGVTSAALFVLFTAVVAFDLIRGNSVPCGCFGSSDASPVGKSTVVRNLALLLFAICATLFANPYLDLMSEQNGPLPQLPPTSNGIPLALLTAAALSTFVLAEALVKSRKV